MRPAAGRRAGARRGIALAAALGLLVLAAALLAGSAMASADLGRAARASLSAARAGAEARRAAGVVLQGWDGGLDSLPVGASVERTLAAGPPSGPPMTIRARVRRLTPMLYATTVTVQVGSNGAEQAFRHVRLLLERSADTLPARLAASVAPLARWRWSELP